ncbi:MAG TPA: redoxin domain-containing protein [Gemmataceae bacterium]|jgi:peroxiredoxin|nr:redoxin domain-containing protein [Gemmataceae bacterium]
MIELVQLERRHEDFAKRNTRVIVASVEGLDLAQQTQEKCPHLLVLADAQRGLTEAGGLIHAHAGPEGADIATPTTILLDREGIVRWIFRPSQVVERLSPDEVLQAVDEHLGGK